MRLMWLADVLRDAGLRVVERPGWESRGRDLSVINGVVWHHDAAAISATDKTVEGLLERGRVDLPGPLSQLALRRDGTWVVIAAGRANHNGYGEWGNDSIGIEARNNGVGQSWPTVQIDAYVTGTAAIAAHLGLDIDRVKGHKETDPKRKIDPAGIDMNVMRARIRALLTPPDLNEETDMAAKLIQREGGGWYTITDTHIRSWAGITKTWAINLAKFTGTKPPSPQIVNEESFLALTANLQDTRTGKKFVP